MLRPSQIICIGRNYVEHAKELGNKTPTSPFYFLKPVTAAIATGEDIVIPPKCTEVHHEVELAVYIGKQGRNIPITEAMEYIKGYTVALDMTARDLQAAAKKAGLPWTESKGYDTFCPLGRFIPAAEVKDPHNLTLWCEVDGAERQRGVTSDMVFRIPELIAHVSSIQTLGPGDVILTGTPHGVGPLTAGQKIRAGLGQGDVFLEHTVRQG